MFAWTSLIVIDPCWPFLCVHSCDLFSEGASFHSIGQNERAIFVSPANSLSTHTSLQNDFRTDNLSHTSRYYAAGHSSNWEKLTIIRYLLILPLLSVAECCWKGRIEMTQRINLPGRFQITLSLFLLSFFCYLLLLVQANLEHSKYTSDFYPLGF